MKIAIICSNNLSLKQNTQKGTEIIVWSYLHEIAKYSQNKDIKITAFASGDSEVPVEIQSITHKPSSANSYISSAGKHVIYELALISKAFTMQDEFDLYHVHIGDGDIVLPFAPFVKKPILITMYHPANANYASHYYDLFRRYNNIHFVTPTKKQQTQFPTLSYVGAIPHGVDETLFAFNAIGGEKIIWAGRTVPDKGMDTVLKIAHETKKPAHLFGIFKKSHENWMTDILSEYNKDKHVSIILGKKRLELIKYFQNSKLFLFPIRWEEPFGLVLVEALACGTPIVAFGKGSIPEIVKDGKTGFIVNPSDEDIRGNWIIKKTGLEGLKEAVERIYAMPEKEYKKMRQECRKHIEENFTVKRMVDAYEKVYRDILAKDIKK